MATINGEHFTVPQAAEYMKLSQASVRQYVWDGTLESVKFGVARVISQKECDRYLKERRPRGNPSFKPKRGRKK